MTPARDTPRRPRRRLLHWFRPQGSRTLVLGVCGAVGGIAGSVRSALEGGGLLQVTGLFGLGALGVLLTIAWILNYGGKP
ncbi:hypothetical protein ACFVS9_27160 [Streptomyces sp. NPDC058008]|uniref:hypothetical protein n=1 Tax=Streptomyces sp. NPDC058008 TaxID=3346303 RepID=UPI0036E7ED58